MAEIQCGAVPEQNVSHGAKDVVIDQPDVVVLGAGVSGLTVARKLAATGLKVAVIDGCPRAGGLHQSWTYGEMTFDIGSIFFWSKGSFFDAFPEIESLCHPASYKIQKISPSGRILQYPFDLRAEFLDATVSEKLLIALSVFAGRVLYNQPKSALEFLYQRIGKRMTRDSGLLNHIERLFSVPAHRVSISLARSRMQTIAEQSKVTSIISKLLGKYHRKEALIVSGRTCYARPREGFDRMYDSIVAAMQSEGVKFYFNSPLERVDRDNEGRIHTEFGGKVLTSDRVFNSLPLELSVSALPSKIEVPESMPLYTMMCSFVGRRGFSDTVLYNFRKVGEWKRLTVHSDYYGKTSCGCEFFSVEVPSVRSNMDAKHIFEDFRISLDGLGLFDGNLSLVDIKRTEFAYPILSEENEFLAKSAVDEIERSYGIRQIGRQGRFEYIPSADSAAQKIGCICIDSAEPAHATRENVAMSMTMDDSIKRWTAKRKMALVIEIIQGKTTVLEASRSFDLTPLEIEGWVEDAKRGMENSLRANPLDIGEQHEKQLRDVRSGVVALSRPEA